MRMFQKTLILAFILIPLLLFIMAAVKYLGGGWIEKYSVVVIFSASAAGFFEWLFKKI